MGEEHDEGYLATLHAAVKDGVDDTELMRVVAGAVGAQQSRIQIKVELRRERQGYRHVTVSISALGDVQEANESVGCGLNLDALEQVVNRARRASRLRKRSILVKGYDRVQLMAGSLDSKLLLAYRVKQAEQEAAEPPAPSQQEDEDELVAPWSPERPDNGGEGGEIPVLNLDSLDNAMSSSTAQQQQRRGGNTKHRTALPIYCGEDGMCGCRILVDRQGDPSEHCERPRESHIVGHPNGTLTGKCAHCHRTPSPPTRHSTRSSRGAVPAKDATGSWMQESLQSMG